MGKVVEIYYIDTIEQIKATEDSPFTVNEYGGRQQIKDENLDQVKSRMHSKVANVLNDLISTDPSNNHYYMDIKIVNSDGGIEEKYKCGTKQPVERKDEPEPETPVEEG